MDQITGTQVQARFLCVVLISGCASQPVVPPATKPILPSVSLPGPSVANHSAAIMSWALKRLHESVAGENACTQPEVYQVIPIKAVPWDTKDQTVVLHGPVFEHWRVLACGLYLEVYMMIRPTQMLKEGFAVGISYRRSKPFEIQPLPTAEP